MRLGPRAWTLLLLFCACAQRAPSPRNAGDVRETVFDRYTPLSRAEEIARRTLTPLTFRIGQQALASRGEAFRQQQIDLAKESFVVYLPGGAPPKDGYGLLVFIARRTPATRRGSSTAASRWRCSPGRISAPGIRSIPSGSTSAGSPAARARRRSPRWPTPTCSAASC